MTTFIIGDLLTGRRIQTLSVESGTWTDVLNAVGEVQVTVSLRDPDTLKLGLAESALPGKAFLAAVDGDTVLQAGPIWLHDWNADEGTLRLVASGMWSYFDHRTLLPVLAGRLPSDPTTDTNFSIAGGTASSLQGIVRALVAQAQTWTGGNVPVVLPTAIAGTSERAYRGIDLAPVAQRIREITQVEGGPDVRFRPRWTTDKLGIQWLLEIGTPTEPELFSAVRPVFNVGVADSSVSAFRVNVNGTQLASQSFATGGRSTDMSLVATATDATLTNAGFPLLESVDSSHSTVELVSTLQGYANEMVLKGRKPTQTWSFTHNLRTQPFLGSFSSGDYALVRVKGDHYIRDGEYVLRITSRTGEAEGKTVSLTFQPEVV